MFESEIEQPITIEKPDEEETNELIDNQLIARENDPFESFLELTNGIQDKIEYVCEEHKNETMKVIQEEIHEQLSLINETLNEKIRPESEPNSLLNTDKTQSSTNNTLTPSSSSEVQMSNKSIEVNIDDFKPKVVINEITEHHQHISTNTLSVIQSTMTAESEQTSEELKQSPDMLSEKSEFEEKLDLKELAQIFSKELKNNENKLEINKSKSYYIQNDNGKEIENENESENEKKNEKEGTKNRYSNEQNNCELEEEEQLISSEKQELESHQSEPSLIVPENSENDESSEEQEIINTNIDKLNEFNKENIIPNTPFFGQGYKKMGDSNSTNTSQNEFKGNNKEYTGAHMQIPPPHVNTAFMKKNGETEKEFADQPYSEYEYAPVNEFNLNPQEFEQEMYLLENAEKDQKNLNFKKKNKKINKNKDCRESQEFQLTGKKQDVNLDIFDLNNSIGDEYFPNYYNSNEQLITPGLNKYGNDMQVINNEEDGNKSNSNNNNNDNCNINYNNINNNIDNNNNNNNNVIEISENNDVNCSQYTLTQKDSENLSSYNSYHFDYRLVTDNSAEAQNDSIGIKNVEVNNELPGQEIASEQITNDGEQENALNFKIIDEDSNSFGYHNIPISQFPVSQEDTSYFGCGLVAEGKNTCHAEDELTNKFTQNSTSNYPDNPGNCHNLGYNNNSNCGNSNNNNSTQSTALNELLLENSKLYGNNGKLEEEEQYVSEFSIFDFSEMLNQNISSQIQPFSQKNIPCGCPHENMKNVPSAKKLKQKKMKNVEYCNGKKIPSWAENKEELEKQIKLQYEKFNPEEDIFGKFVVPQLDLNYIFNCQRYPDTRNSSPWLSASEQESTPSTKLSNKFIAEQIHPNAFQSKAELLEESSSNQSSNFSKKQDHFKNTESKKSPFKKLLESFEKTFFLENKSEV